MIGMLDWAEKETEVISRGRARGLIQRLHSAAEEAGHRRTIDECAKKINQCMKRYLCCRVDWISISEGDDYNEIAETLMKLRDYELTLSGYYSRRGNAYLALGELKKARSDLEEAARLR